MIKATATFKGVQRIKENLAAIYKDPTDLLKAGAETVLDDIIKERIDGERTIDNAAMKENAPSTKRRKARKGKPDHSLWDSQLMRKKSQWKIFTAGKTKVFLQPGTAIAGRAVWVQEKGYDFFGISKLAQRKTQDVLADLIRKKLERGL